MSLSCFLRILESISTSQLFSKCLKKASERADKTLMHYGFNAKVTMRVKDGAYGNKQAKFLRKLR